jgi:hypothetical protein
VCLGAYHALLPSSFKTSTVAYGRCGSGDGVGIGDGVGDGDGDDDGDSNERHHFHHDRLFSQMKLINIISITISIVSVASKG